MQQTVPLGQCGWVALVWFEDTGGATRPPGLRRTVVVHTSERQPSKLTKDGVSLPLAGALGSWANHRFIIVLTCRSIKCASQNTHLDTHCDPQKRFQWRALYKPEKTSDKRWVFLLLSPGGVKLRGTISCELRNLVHCQGLPLPPRTPCSPGLLLPFCRPRTFPENPGGVWISEPPLRADLL